VLPDGHRSLLIADTTRAEEWRDGLAAAGFHPALAETRGADADKGGWYLGVPDSEAMAARGFVADVLGGRAELPRSVRLPAFGRTALFAIALLVTALATGLWLALR
jgi:hypothetical protein